MYKRQAAGFITLGISGVACIGSLVWFMRSKMLDKLALKKDIDSKVDRSAEDSVKVIISLIPGVLFRLFRMPLV